MNLLECLEAHDRTVASYGPNHPVIAGSRKALVQAITLHVRKEVAAVLASEAIKAPVSSDTCIYCGGALDGSPLVHVATGSTVCERPAAIPGLPFGILR